MRESRKRKLNNELRDSDDWFQFLCNTPFSSKATGSGRFEAFLGLRSSNAPTPESNAEKNITNLHCETPNW